MTESVQGDTWGEGRAVFSTTHWTVVLQAADLQTSHGRAALEKLCRTYWRPIFAYIRRKGCLEADAKDLTQQFFAELLRRNDFGRVDLNKGKFRTFLLVCLGHFLSNQRDFERAAKRGGGKEFISFDAMTMEELRSWEPRSELSPDKVFDQRWAMRLLEEAVTRLQDEMTAGGKVKQFERLKPYLASEPVDGEYEHIAKELGIAGSTVAVLVHRMRQRCGELVRLEVANTVSTPLELEEEMRHLNEVLQY
jgi:DNA-directed RNA polymerase specialized sigma24 family protein